MLISTGPHFLQPYWLGAHTMAIWGNVVRVGHVRVRWHCFACECGIVEHVMERVVLCDVRMRVGLCDM